MANKKAIGHETEDITLTLHKYGSLNDLLADTQIAPTLDPFKREKRWVGTSEVLGIPRKVSLGDLRIDKEYYDSFRLGDNTWVRVNIYTRFGIKTSLWVNEDILSGELPWTVWVPVSEEENKYGIHAKFCGLVFRTQAEAQTWVNENIPPEPETVDEQENSADSVGDAEQ